MRLKEMISEQRSFDFLTNSSCYYQTKDIEKIMENMDILMLKHQCICNNQFGIFYKYTLYIFQDRNTFHRFDKFNTKYNPIGLTFASLFFPFHSPRS